MPRKTPTTAQMDILELLSRFEYLTTRQVDEYLRSATTKRATEQKLRLLKLHGFIQVRLLHPERGAASERCWMLLRKGADAVGLEGVSNTHEPGQWVSGNVSNKYVLTPRQVAVLQLLIEMKHLSTQQIGQHLHTDKPRWYTWKLLNLLRRRRYLRWEKLYPERGAASEYIWTISRRGAIAIGAVYDSRYRRRPTRQTIEHRGLLLKMNRQIEEAGWLLMKPIPYSPRRLQPEETRERVETEDTPQRRQLVEAVLRSDEHTIEKLLEKGYALSSLQDRISRWKAGQVGAVVPRRVNEYVAYVPGLSERTVLLIPHPPSVGRAFWTRKPGTRSTRGVRALSQGLNQGRYVRHTTSGVYSTTGSRIDRYSRLACVVPILAVFGCEGVARQYADVLTGAGIGWVLVEEIADWLRSLQVG